MAESVIPEPQRTYVLELLAALGSAAQGFVLVGAQALKFVLPHARGTRDFDFVLDVLALRDMDISLTAVLHSLGYRPDPKARNFQFEKPVPNSEEVMRIEFMAPVQFQRPNDFRVDVQPRLHARACEGAGIVLVEADEYEISGILPGGNAANVTVKVIRPHALVMLKCLATDERYRNLRGLEHRDYDRSEARTHVEDIVAVLSAEPNLDDFRARFIKQFEIEPPLREKTVRMVQDYFADETKPGILLYEERLRERLPLEEVRRHDLRSELQRAQRIVASLLVR